MNYIDIFNLLDLETSGMEEVKKAVNNKNYDGALQLLKQYFINRKTPYLFIEERDKESIVEFAKENFKEDVKEVLKVAEEVSNKEFVFRFRWDMEMTNIPVKFDGEIKWDLVPYNDPEWPWMMNRHRYWIALGQAYWITGNEKYAKTFCEQLEHWIDNNPFNCPGKFYTWRTIECGIRCENWLKSYQYFKNSGYFSDKLFAKFLISIHEQCEHIYNTYNGFKKTSNWGVLENHGLFEASTYIYEYKNSVLWNEQSILRLKRAANLQVMKDGVHWEQSTMYHNEILHCFMDNIILAQKNGIKLDEDILSTAKKMAYVDMYYAKPNHRQPMKGDSDDTDVRDLITRAAIIFKDETLKFGGYATVDFENLFTFGIDALTNYNSMKAVEPKDTSYAFNTSGNYVMRSGWNEKDLYLNFHCGKIGAGHDHADTFNIDIQAYGNDLITDPGRYTYMEGEWRDYFKECKAHNTTIVDDVNFTEWDGAWGIERTADAFAQTFIKEDEFEYVEGAHKGYAILEDPVYPFRKVIYVKACNNPYWILIDAFEAKKKHKYSQYFHFMPGQVVLDEETNICYSKYEKKANLRIIPTDSKKVKGSLKDTYISFKYNEKEENKTIEYTHIAEGFASMINVLYPQKSGEKFCPKIEKIAVYNNAEQVVKDSMAEAFKVIFNDNEEHIILISHRVPASHTNFYIVEGIQVYGEIILIKRSLNNEQVITIK